MKTFTDNDSPGITAMALGVASSQRERHGRRTFARVSPSRSASTTRRRFLQVGTNLVLGGVVAGAGMDATSRRLVAAERGQPTDAAAFRHAGVIDAWEAYRDELTFGKGQTLALLDDGCKLSMPEWSTPVDGVPKVLATHDSVDGDDDPKHEGRGYHGSTIGVPSSLNFQGRWGVAYNNQVTIVRALECCHCKIADHKTLAAGLRWVIDNHQRYRITAVNLAPVDDLEHAAPVPTEIDEPLARLRELGVWVSAPAGNHNFTRGISWPACQPQCFAIGAVKAGKDEVYLDRHAKIDLVVPAAATSSSNAIVCGAVLLLREAINKWNYEWRRDGKTLPDAMLAIFQASGVAVLDPATQLTFRRLDVKAALDRVRGH
ncbi:MAG: S8/S53 family peptidase [Pirellulales bacterium]